MVTRRAILVAVPGTGKSFLRGVKEDTNNVEDHLCSETGGYFYPNEVTKLYNPTYKELLKVLQENTADYLFVYFSGHGFTDDDFTRRICLKDCTIPDTFLFNASPRQLVIVDACGNYVGQGIGAIQGLGEQWSNFIGSRVRAMFDQRILNSSYGKIILHATKSGFSALEYPNGSGGVFTTTLLHVADNIDADGIYTTASIEVVLHHVKNELKRIGSHQEPEITYASGRLTVPFAFGIPRPPKSPPQIPRKPTPPPPSGKSDLWGVALLGLTIWAIASSGKKK